MRPFAALALLLLLAACAGRERPMVSPAPPSPDGYPPVPQRLGVYKIGDPYVVDGVLYVPRYDPHYDATGLASWYGPEFHGRETANGEIFDARRPSAAHPTLPLPSLVEVTNLENGRRIVVRVNDRGPFRPGRIIDLSDAAARALGFREQGLARVRVRFLRLAEARGTPPVLPAVTAARSWPEPRAAEPGPACTPAALVQVGAFADPARAHHHAERLAALAPVRIEWVETRSGRLGRVQVAASPGRELDLLRRLLDMGYGEAHLVHRPAGCVRAGDVAAAGRTS
ncbi:Endolytic peptidoglycan transglycosylase RlpA [bacterium HR39]|nr:Endolytic peptidoglycan transglycosylase RlpA [bacterium HR39]